VKVGALILGVDKNWGFHVDEKARRQMAIDEANELIETVDDLILDERKVEVPVED
jgi:hypothetical protein